MAKHLPTHEWHTNFSPKNRGCFCVVKTANKTSLNLGIVDANDRHSLSNIPRTTARLLAKRILQCLDASK